VAGRFVMAFVMDAIESVDIAADTTFALMLEAQRRGHELLYMQLHDIGVRGGQAVARAAPISLRREPGRHFTLGQPRLLALDEAVDFVFQRKDPPVNAAYAAATQILSLCRRALVWNHPHSLLSANEKLYALHFADLMPATLVSRDMAALLDFLEEQGGQMVVKPLDGKGGEGIFHLRPGDPNLRSILEQSTAFGARWAMAQAYVPEVRRGDKRILLLEGEPLGALLRIPAAGESRANLHVGGRAVRAGLDSADRRIIERIAPRLRRDGLFFVGIDVIGGRLTEINVTSPTGLQEMNALDGARYEERIFERIEALLAQRG